MRLLPPRATRTGILLPYTSLFRAFSTILHPLFSRFLRWGGGRRATASVVVLVGFVLAVGIPLILFMGLVASEAVTLSTTILPWIRERIQESDALAGHLPDWLPFSSDRKSTRLNSRH